MLICRLKNDENNSSQLKINEGKMSFKVRRSLIGQCRVLGQLIFFGLAFWKVCYNNRVLF